ncbi:IS3 family transposase [Spiroplasma endosymbiont of Colias croceus]
MINIIVLQEVYYIIWYNNIRIHSTLNYLTPINYQKQMSTKK